MKIASFMSHVYNHPAYTELTELKNEVIFNSYMYTTAIPHGIYAQDATNEKQEKE